MANRKANALSMLQLLEQYAVLAESELMTRLGVDASAVQQFAASLQQVGVKLLIEPATDLRYSLVIGRQIPPLVLDDGEFAAVVAALEHGVEYVEDDGFYAALNKLRRFIPNRLRERIDDMVEELTDAAPFDEDDEDYNDFPYYDSNKANQHVDTLKAAVEINRRVNITYRSNSEEKTKRDVDPYGVVKYKSKWYMVGYCHLRRDLRVFRLDNILKVSVLAQEFQPPVGFDAQNYVAQGLANIC